MTWAPESQDESAGRKGLLLPLAGVAQGYRAAAALHRGVYERHLLQPRRLPCCVVSVGSLLVGGSGKTPLAAWIARELRRRGHRSVLASRGYGGRGRDQVILVSDGKRVYSDASEAGDEPMVLVAQAPGVPVVVGRDRGLAGLRAVSAFDVDVLVLDDGFQHHRLARDVEIIAFDGAFGLGNGHVLPRGPLREGASALSRADAVGVIDPPLAVGAENRIARWAPDAMRLEAHRRFEAIRDLAGTRPESPDVLEGARVGMLTGIANPAAFRHSLEDAGATVVAERAFRDHHRYRAQDLRGLREQAPMWVTTQKDAMKILPSWLGSLDLRVAISQLELEDPDGFLDWLEGRVEAARVVG